MTTTTLLSPHLDQISLCATSISTLTFPSPKIFSNALLKPHDITALIRDTETHERALFSVPPPQPRAQDPAASTSNRRATTFRDQQQQQHNKDGGVRAPRRNTAVAAVLGEGLVERIRKGGGGGAGSGLGYRERGEVDVEVLLEGAGKLCSV